MSKTEPSVGYVRDNALLALLAEELLLSTAQSFSFTTVVIDPNDNSVTFRGDSRFEDGDQRAREVTVEGWELESAYLKDVINKGLDSKKVILKTPDRKASTPSE